MAQPKAQLDLEKFLRGGRSARQAVDSALAAYARARGGVLLQGVEVSTTPKNERLCCHECRGVVVFFPGASSAEHQLPACEAWRQVELGRHTLERFLGDCGHPDFVRCRKHAKLRAPQKPRALREVKGR